MPERFAPMGDSPWHKPFDREEKHYFGYLLSPHFQIRQAMAAHWLRDCETIVDVGGYIMPMSYQFPEDKHVYVIDPWVGDLPDTPAAHAGFVEHLSIEFREWEMTPEDLGIGEYGFVTLGYDGFEPEKIIEFVNNSRRAVLETARPYWQVTLDLVKSTRRKLVAKYQTVIEGDFSDITYSQMTPIGDGRNLRFMYVLE